MREMCGFLTAAESAGHEPPPACISSNRGEKDTDPKDHQSIWIFDAVFYFLETVCSYVKPILALFYHRSRLSRVR